jgi:hypothetical protein
LPDDHNLPSICLELACDGRVSLHVLSKFFFPKFLIRLWLGGLSASVPVPVAPVNEDNNFQARKNYIGCSRQIRCVKPEPVTHSMECGAHPELQLAILRFNGTHDL